MSKEYDEYEKLAKVGMLPADFDQWQLADMQGWTVAHIAALYRHLPDNFKQWGLASADNDGWTVAHVAAMINTLPVLGPWKFTQWDLADDNGWTVAHEAACRGNLPADFSQWGLANNDGLTVLRRLLLNTTNKYVDRWEKERPLCETDVDWGAFKIELPEIYQKYIISEHMLDTDDNQMALQRALL
jgi:hypothetical protein